MRIGQINSNIYFSRAINIKLQKSKKNSIKADKAISEICDVINNKPSKTYSNETCSQIRSFFCDILGDCDGKTPVIAEKNLNGNYVLLSGKEARKIQSFKENAEKNIKEYKKNAGISYATKLELINRTEKAIQRSVQYVSENGCKNKKDSSITIQPYKGSDKKQHLKIQYYTITSSFSPAEMKNKYYTDTTCDYREANI